jgi:hypothetical protein
LPIAADSFKNQAARASVRLSEVRRVTPEY